MKKRARFSPLTVAVVVLSIAGVLLLQQGGLLQQQGLSSIPRAKEAGYTENQWDEEDYSQAGFVGDWDNDVATKTPHISEANVSSITPACFTEYIVWGGETKTVNDCYEPPKTSYYQALCRSAHQEARRICEQLCANTSGTAHKCLNWQLQPRYYKEWGCLGQPPPPVAPGVTRAIPHQYCAAYYGCICTEVLE